MQEFLHCYWHVVMCDSVAVACCQLSLSAWNNSLCPFQTPSRKAIGGVGGMLTLLVTAVLFVFGGLLLEHHSKDRQEVLNFL